MTGTSPCEIYQVAAVGGVRWPRFYGARWEGWSGNQCLMQLWCPLPYQPHPRHPEILPRSFLWGIRKRHIAGHYLHISEFRISSVVWFYFSRRPCLISTFKIWTIRHRKVKNSAQVCKPEIKLISPSSTGSPSLPSHPNCHTTTAVKGISKEEINFIAVLLFESTNRLSIKNYNLSNCDHWLQVYEIYLNGLHGARNLSPSIYGTYITKLCKSENA